MDFKDRLKFEYSELETRYIKLVEALEAQDNGTAKFKFDDTLKVIKTRQKNIMLEYLLILEENMKYLNIEYKSRRK